MYSRDKGVDHTLKHTAKQQNTLQNAATNCNALQYTAHVQVKKGSYSPVWDQEFVFKGVTRDDVVLLGV